MGSSLLMNDPAWRPILQQAAMKTKAFSAAFMGDTFFRPFSAQSDLVYDAIDSDHQQVLIIAHRGFGKTSAARAAVLKKICFRQSKFIVPVSSTASAAELSAANMQQELQTNMLIRNIFGDLRDPDNWAVKHFIAGDTYILPRGAEQQIRGLNFRNERPNFFLVDDLEDSEAVSNPERRAKLKQWFFSDLMGSVDRGKKDWKVVVIGTLLHEDSLLATLMEDPAWHVVNIPLCNDNLQSMYPEYMSDEEVRKLYDSYVRLGIPDTFAREYQNKPISMLDASFKAEYWKDRYYEPSSLLDNPNIYYVTIVDPAKTTNISSDYTAIVTIGVDLSGHALYFHDCISERLHPDEIYNEAFKQVLHHGSRALCVEVTSLHEFITQPFRSELRKRNIHTNFVELKARDKKENRIAQLVPFYRQGYIYHNARVSSKLELQLMSFPRSKNDDVSDAFAYIIEALDLDESYFYAPELPGEDEYADLPKESSYPISWRCA